MTDIPEMTITSSIGNAGWRLHECQSAHSTNDLARELPAWSAVRANAQTGGRGRFGRVFVSDPGGLWISAVLPAAGGPAKWAGFSLMVGIHLVKMLEDLAVPHARLRWPNDLMAGPLKLGGLLIEQTPRETLVVGFGLNVSNSPWHHDVSLAATSTSLARLLPSPPALPDVTRRTLDALAEAHEEMEIGGMASAISQLNARWTVPTPVELTLSDGRRITGRFTGLDPRGHLRMLDHNDCEFLAEHQSLERLVELESLPAVHTHQS